MTSKKHKMTTRDAKRLQSVWCLAPQPLNHLLSHVDSTEFLSDGHSMSTSFSGVYDMFVYCLIVLVLFDTKYVLLVYR